MCSQRHFVRNLRRWSVPVSKREIATCKDGLRMSIREIPIVQCQGRSSDGVKIRGMRRQCIRYGGERNEEFNVTSSVLVSSPQSQATHSRSAFRKNNLQFGFVYYGVRNQRHDRHLKQVLVGRLVKADAICQWSIPTKSEAVIPSTQQRIARTHL